MMGKGRNHNFVMRGLGPRIHDLLFQTREQTWMAGTSPAMTTSSKGGTTPCTIHDG